MSDMEGREASAKPIRLQAYLASCGIGSRRACEKLISQGRVSVDGLIAELGSSVSPGAEVRLDGKQVRPQARLRYIMLNKPPGFVTSMSDERDRPVAAALLGAEVGERVYNVGRLDQWSSGLLLFTNDGELTARMVHPSGRFDKEYLVETDLPIPSDLARRFEAGLRVEDIVYRAESVRLVSEKVMRVVLIEGKNREIRRVLQHYGLRALALRRLRVGPLELGELPEGAHRELTGEETASLRAYRGPAEGAKRGRAR